MTWMTLNCAGLDNGVGNSMDWADTRSIERISCYLVEWGLCERELRFVSWSTKDMFTLSSEAASLIVDNAKFLT